MALVCLGAERLRRGPGDPESSSTSSVPLLESSVCKVGQTQRALLYSVSRAGVAGKPQVEGPGLAEGPSPRQRDLPSLSPTFLTQSTELAEFLANLLILGRSGARKGRPCAGCGA